MGPSSLFLTILSPFLLAMLFLTLIVTLSIYGALLSMIIIATIAYLYIRFDAKHSSHEEYDGQKSWDYGPSLARYVEEVRERDS